ncbi:MAG: tetraacyldisaccharide 4'-kinase [Flavobacteriia bacterium]|nr:tetraacyldisaccharide 4'-kinase [Flavobacteriia bacterium]
MHRLRILLLPLSWVYGFITFIRNCCFDFGILPQFIIPKKSICVGNLAVGGTGKTPHIIYLTQLLNPGRSITILSRGYGRKTNGFLLANESSTTTEIGDEPLLYYKRFTPSTNITVCENRKEGVQQIQKLFPSNEIILLDDAFQHRAVKAGKNLLITDYKSLYTDDFVMPAGNLREWKIGRKRADIVIVSKCPEELTDKQKEKIIQKLKFNAQKIYFSKIKYSHLISFGIEVQTPIENVFIVAGISNPKPLINFLSEKYTVESIQFSDHHEFTEQEIEIIHQKFDTFATQNKAIITTEKDFVRLVSSSLMKSISKYPWFYQSIEIEIDNKEAFNKYITNYVDTI